MREPRFAGPSWLVLVVFCAGLAPARAELRPVGIPGADKPPELLMNEFPVLPPEARKKFDITAQDPTAVADLGVVDFFQLVADILKMNIVVADRSKLENRKVGIVMRDMSIEEAVHLVLQMNDLKAVHFNENTIIVMDRASKADFGLKQAQRFRLRYTTIDKVQAYINLNKNLQRQLGDSITFDPPNNTIIAIDNPENLSLLEKVLGEIDIPPMKILEAVKLSYLDFTTFAALARTLGQDIVTRLAAIGMSYNKDARAIMVYGTPEDVKLIRMLVEKFDIAPKQVLLDTVFLQVSDTFDKEFGFKFTNGTFTVNQLDRLKDIDRLRAGLAGPPPVFPTQTQINYLIAKTGAKTIQSPKVRAVDGTPATINIGEIRNVQIQSTATTLGTGLTPGQQQTTFNTQEVPIGVQVNVTPTIHNDDSVTLDMKISVTKVLEIKSFGVDRTTQDSTTKLRMRNGETVVLGGFINEETSTDDTPIPLLGEVPILDKIFKDTKRNRTESELVFLLTPYILDFQDKLSLSDHTEVPATARNARRPAGPPAPAARRSAGGPAPSARSEQSPGMAELPHLVDDPTGPLTPRPLELAEAGRQPSANGVEFGKPEKLEVRKTHVIEGKDGTTRIVTDQKGHVLAKSFIPKGAAGSAESVEIAGEHERTEAAADALAADRSSLVHAEAVAAAQPRASVVMARAESAAGSLPGRRSAALEAVIRQHRAALAADDTDNLKRIAELARTTPRGSASERAARGRLPGATTSLAAAPIDRLQELAAPPHPGPKRGRPTRRASRPAPGQAPAEEALAPMTEHEELERLHAERAKDAGAARSADTEHPLLEELHRERLADARQRAALKAAEQAKAAEAHTEAIETARVLRVRAARAAAEAARAAELASAEGAASGPDRVRRRVRPAARFATRPAAYEEPDEVDEPADSGRGKQEAAANGAKAASRAAAPSPIASARPEALAGSRGVGMMEQHDQDLIKRLRELTATGPAGPAETRSLAGARQASTPDAKASFDELARSVEGDLGKM